MNIKTSISFARKLHMLSAYWAFILIAIHFGIHWNIFWNRLKKGITSSIVRVGLKIVGVIVAIYGVYAFTKRNLISYMFLRTQFVFFDFSEPKLLFYLDYLCIIEAFVLLAHISISILKMS